MAERDQLVATPPEVAGQAWRVPASLVVGVGSISTAAVLFKLCDEAPAVVTGAARLGIATAILVPIAIGLRGSRLLSEFRRHAGATLLAGALLAAHFLCWIISLRHTSVLSSVVIVTTNPIFVGAASFLLFGERPTRRLLVGIVLAAGGGGVIAASDASEVHGSLYGDGMALIAAVMMSSYLLVGRRARGRADLLSYVTPLYTTAAVLLCGGALVSGSSFSGYANSTYGYFLLLAVVPQLLGHSALNWALRHVSATVLSVAILGEPIGAAALAWWVLGEAVSLAQVAGSGMILLGIVVATRIGVPTESDPRSPRHGAAGPSEKSVAN